MTTPKIRTLVVDDSVFMRTILKNSLSHCSAIEVIGSAQNGKEALEKIKSLKPDVVTLDIEMPGLTGLEVLRRVMREKPIPIVMVSTKTQKGAQMTFEALDLGAVDYVAKPLADKKSSLQKFQEKVVKAVQAAFSANRSRLGNRGQLRVHRPRQADIQCDGVVIAIGISAGGPATLHKLLPAIPASFPPILITQHMPADFTKPFAVRLNDSCQLNVKEARDRDELVPGMLLIAPGNHHLSVVRRGSKLCAKLDDGPKVSGFRPSVDVLFSSIAKAVGAKAIGLIMTGMGCDGSIGLKELKAAGAQTAAQDQESSIVFGMPRAAAETGCVDHVVSLEEIPEMLVRMLSTPVTSTS